MYRAMLVIGAALLLILSAPAFGRPASKDVDAKRARPLASIKPLHAHPHGITSLSARTTLGVGSQALVAEARKYMGTNPTDRKTLWCAAFMNFVLAKIGYAGTNSDAAKSFTLYGRRISEPRIGAIAVLSRGRRGGHVGVVSGINAQGNPIIISGNHNKRVGESVYPRARVIAYVMPTGRHEVPVRVADRAQPSRVPSEPGIDSPIAELIAAIEAEQSRAERPNPHAAPPRSSTRYRLGQRAGERGAQRDLPLDPALAEFLGFKARAQSVQPRTPRQRG
jgi:uncharacterized protein (TIGR02594 family)